MSIPNNLHDTFVHDGKVYNLAMVRKLTRSDPAFILPITHLLWVLAYDTPDPKRVEAARLRWPLLVTKWHSRWCAIDGLHRLERCRQRGISVVPVREISPEILEQALIRTRR